VQADIEADNSSLTIELTESMGRVLGIRESLPNVRPMKLMGDRHPLRAGRFVSETPAFSAGSRTQRTCCIYRRTYATDGVLNKKLGREAFGK
jgi:hypothetical protein